MEERAVSPSSGRLAKVGFHLKVVAGWVTADRHLEAKARAELETGRRKPSAADIERAEHEVHHAYGEDYGTS